MMRVYLVDDEALALKRLERLLAGKAEVVGLSTDPAAAIGEIERLRPDVLFLDIQMPELTGFQLLERLERPPMVVFTTAYSEFALKAFEVESVDYLLKPIDPEALDRALGRLEKRSAGSPDLAALLRRLAPAAAKTPKRIASKIGDKIELIDLDEITHFFAKDKLTFAATAKKEYIVDDTITALEERLDGEQFLRIHRSTILNLKYVKELHNWFAGRMMVRLSDGKATELAVSRERVQAWRERLGV